MLVQLIVKKWHVHPEHKYILILQYPSTLYHWRAKGSEIVNRNFHCIFTFFFTKTNESWKKNEKSCFSFYQFQFFCKAWNNFWSENLCAVILLQIFERNPYNLCSCKVLRLHVSVELFFSVIVIIMVVHLIKISANFFIFQL